LNWAAIEQALAENATLLVWLAFSAATTSSGMLHQSLFFSM
jgi:hypothetical protein